MRAAGRFGNALHILIRRFTGAIHSTSSLEAGEIAASLLGVDKKRKFAVALPNNDLDFLADSARRLPHTDPGLPSSPNG